MQDVASGISDLFGVGTGTVGVVRSAVRYSTGPSHAGVGELCAEPELVAISGLCRVGVCAVGACCGSVRVAVLVGVELGIGDGVSPNGDSAAVILDF